MDRRSLSLCRRCALLFALITLSGCALFHQRQQPPQPAQEAPAPAAVQPAGPQPREVVETVPPEPPKPEEASPLHKGGKRGKPYRVNGKTYYPLLSAQGYEEKGVASWYGPSRHGRKTSCGEVFDMYRVSAAHKLLPMRTRVHVTNLENGRELTLVVNDRGPFIHGRVIDLSYGAAKSLGIVEKGLARVEIRSAGQVRGQKNNDLLGEFFVHIGSFDAEAPALCLLKDMQSLRYKRSLLKVIKVERDGDKVWRVELGPYPSMSAANKAHGRTVKDYPSAFVVAK